MPVLFAKIAGGWVPIGGPSGSGSDEVHVGTEPPTGVEELWYDTDAPGITPEDLRWNSAWGQVAITGSSDVAVGAGSDQPTQTLIRTMTPTLFAGRRYQAEIRQINSYITGATLPGSYQIYISVDGVSLGSVAYSIDYNGNYLSAGVTPLDFTVATTGSHTVTMLVSRNTTSSGTLQARFFLAVNDVGPVLGNVGPNPLTVLDRWNTAWGQIATETTTVTDGTTVITNMALCGVNGVTLLAGRRYRFTVQIRAMETGATGAFVANLYKNGVALPSQAGWFQCQNNYESTCFSYYVTGDGSVANYTIVATSLIGAALKLHITNAPGNILSVEDIGPVSGAVATPDPTPAWTNLTLQNGWVAEGGPSHLSPPRVRKIGDVVSVEGTANQPAFTVGATPFTLPAGYRPPKTLRVGFFAHRTNVGGIYSCRCDVAPAGNLYITDLTPSIVDPTMYFNFSFSVTA